MTDMVVLCATRAINWTGVLDSHVITPVAAF